MKISSAIAATIVVVAVVAGCGEKPPVSVEVKEVCSQPMGTNVAIKSFHLR